MSKRKDTPVVPEILEDPSLEEIVDDEELKAAVEEHDTPFQRVSFEVPVSEESVLTPALPLPVPEVKPKVPLKVFIASSGVRWDQMAGFKSFAKRHGMGPLTILEWRDAFDTFMKRPV